MDTAVIIAASRGFDYDRWTYMTNKVISGAESWLMRNAAWFLLLTSGYRARLDTEWVAQGGGSGDVVRTCFLTLIKRKISKQSCKVSTFNIKKIR